MGFLLSQVEHFIQLNEKVDRTDFSERDQDEKADETD